MRKPSFALLSAFDIDRQKKEGEHGVTTIYTTIIAPGYLVFIKNMATDALQVHVAFTTAMADGTSTVAIVKNNHKAVEVQGVSQTASEDDQPLESEASPRRREQVELQRCRLHAGSVRRDFEISEKLVDRGLSGEEALSCARSAHVAHPCSCRVGAGAGEDPLQR